MSLERDERDISQQERSNAPRGHSYG